MYRITNDDYDTEEQEFERFMEEIYLLPISTKSESDIRKSEAYIAWTIDQYKRGLVKFRQRKHKDSIWSKINELETMLHQLKQVRRD